MPYDHKVVGLNLGVPDLLFSDHAMLMRHPLLQDEPKGRGFDPRLYHFILTNSNIRKYEMPVLQNYQKGVGLLPVVANYFILFIKYSFS